MARIDRDVWFFLIEARVTSDSSRGLPAGSRTLVQCFVLGNRLEDCLAELDAYLPSQHLSRIDTLRAIRFDANADDEEYPGDFFRGPLEAAASRNQCVLGIFVTADSVGSTGEDVH
jgi:hypothetical protein